MAAKVIMVKSKLLNIVIRQMLSKHQQYLVGPHDLGVPNQLFSFNSTLILMANVCCCLVVSKSCNTIKLCIANVSINSRPVRSREF